MGTSHRHKPGGSPNWGKASNSVTKIANAISKSNELIKNPPKEVTPQRLFKRQTVLNRQINNSYHNVVRNVVRAAGGRGKVSTGSSKVMGRSGIVYAGAWASALQEISEQGLETWLEKHGIRTIDGKTIKEVVELLTDFMQDYFTGLDDTAAREALEAVNDMIATKIESNGGDFDKTFQEIVTTEEIKDYLDVFFGVYIFSHLSQAFSERLQKNKGYDEANETMQEIRDLIIDDVKRGAGGRPSGVIDWKGQDGQIFIKKEFDRIINILTDGKD